MSPGRLARGQGAAEVAAIAAEAAHRSRPTWTRAATCWLWTSYITGVEIPVDGGTSGHAGAKFLRDAARRGQA